MATITIRYDARNASAKRLLEFLRTLSFIKIEEDPDTEISPEMAAKIKRGEADIRDGRCVTVRASDIWN